MSCSKSGNTRQKVDRAAIGKAIKYVINNTTRVRMSAFNFGTSKTKLSCHLF
jgi:hypothetical protein